MAKILFAGCFEAYIGIIAGSCADFLQNSTKIRHQRCKNTEFIYFKVFGRVNA